MMHWTIEHLKKSIGRICNLISELSPYFGIRGFVDNKSASNFEIRRQTGFVCGGVFDL